MRVVCTCEVCGLTYTVAADQIRRGRGRFCSRSCNARSRAGLPRKQRRIPEERACAACGTTFLVGGRGNRERKVRVCGIACRNASRFRSGAKAQTLNPCDAAYLAGIIDGEGSIMLPLRNRNVGVLVVIANTHVGLLGWVARTTDVGRVVLNRDEGPRTRACYEWRANGDAAVSVIQQLLPYLIIKRAQADLAISVHDRLRVPALKATHDWQLEARAVMQDMNRRGPRDAVAA